MLVQEGVVMFTSPFTKVLTQRGTELEKQTVVLEYEEGDYKNRIAFENLKSSPFSFRMGDVVTVAISIDASEYNGKWYNRAKCVGMLMPASPWKRFPLNPTGPYRKEDVEEGQPQQRQNQPQQKKDISSDDFQY